MSHFFGPEARAAIIRHPFFLAGLSVVALLALLAGILVLFDSVRGGGATGQPTVVVAPQTTSTPGPVRLTAVASGVIGRTVRVTTVRTAPGVGSPVLGTIPRNTDIEIDARTTDSNWYRVIFPPNSEFHGWIDADDLDITGNAGALVVATAEPPPIIVLPTDSPHVLTAISEQQTADASIPLTETETPTPTADGLPDLVVGSPPILSANQLFVTVINQGTGDAVGDLVVAVFDSEGTALIAGATLPNFTLPAGRSIDVGTNYTVSGNQTLLIIVDPNGTIEESDNFNNRITVSIAAGGPPTENPLAPAEAVPPVEIPLGDVPPALPPA
jgi:uncharacterized protein YraI